MGWEGVGETSTGAAGWGGVPFILARPEHSSSSSSGGRYQNNNLLAALKQLYGLKR